MKKEIYIASSDFDIGAVYRGLFVGTSIDERGCDYNWFTITPFFYPDDPDQLGHGEKYVSLVKRGDSGMHFILMLSRSGKLPSSEKEYRDSSDFYPSSWVEIYDDASLARSGSIWNDSKNLHSES